MAAENTVLGPTTKEGVRDLYDSISRRLGQSRLGDASFFLNYGYVSLGQGDDVRTDIARGLDPNAIRLVYELIGVTQLRDQRVLDIGCGRGGSAALLADRFGADVTGIDLAPEAIAFCRRRHHQPGVRFEIGDAENLPVEAESIDTVVNIESSHAYPNLDGFLAEVRRVLKPGGVFLYADFLPVRRWAEVRAALNALHLEQFADRNITPNVLASCDNVAVRRLKAFGEKSEGISKFLAVPGSDIYEKMRAGDWEYRILRARRR
jgi:ubiquinone/menaquinone biosynthesis C-methylase UbiE